MADDELASKMHALLFGIRRSIRYHHRRVRFFDSLHKTAAFLGAVSGTATLAAVLAKAGPAFTLTFAACVTIFSMVDLVVGTARRARLHNDLAKSYFDIEKDMLKACPPTDELCTGFAVRRLEIEANEPPPLKVLDAICHNELIRAGGYNKDQYVKIAWYQRMFSQFFDIREHAIKYAID